MPMSMGYEIEEPCLILREDNKEIVKIQSLTILSLPLQNNKQPI